mgnify:CR=1 FL=1
MKLIIVACNTISCNILPSLILKYLNVKIIGVVKATVNLIGEGNFQNILVIVTKAAVDSHVYKRSNRTSISQYYS